MNAIVELLMLFAQSFVTEFGRTFGQALATRTAAAIDGHRMEQRFVERLTRSLAPIKAPAISDHLNTPNAMHGYCLGCGRSVTDVSPGCTVAPHHVTVA